MHSQAPHSVSCKCPYQPIPLATFRLFGALSSLAALIALFGALSYLRCDDGEFRTSQKINELVEEALRRWQVPGVAVGIVRNGEITYLKGFGVRQIGRTEPVTPETLFPLASCTKAFTTTALAMLVDEGKLHWDDLVRQHVDYFHLSDPLADANVTLRDLVTHRTGVAPNELLWYHSPWSRREIIRRVGYVRPKYSFRTTFQYQSTMFNVAACALENASGMPWEQFVQRRIFDPLGMTSSNFTTQAAQAQSDHAAPHRKDRDGKLHAIPWYAMEHPDPAGSINSCARDLCRWLMFQLGNGSYLGHRLVSPEKLEETRSPQIVIPLDGSARAMNPETLQMSYGMGWVIQDYRGLLQFSHGGAIDGFRSHITLLPRAGLGIVLLNNCHQTSMNLALSNTLIDHLLNLPQRDWNDYLKRQVQAEAAVLSAKLAQWESERDSRLAPTLPLTDYTGVYEDAGYGTVRVALAEGRLIWRWNNVRSGLTHHRYNTFLIPDGLLENTPVLFIIGLEGKVTAMEVYGTMETRFVRKSESSES